MNNRTTTQTEAHEIKRAHRLITRWDEERTGLGGQHDALPCDIAFFYAAQSAEDRAGIWVALLSQCTMLDKQGIHRELCSAVYNPLVEKRAEEAEKRVRELEAEKLQLSDHFDHNAGLLRARVVKNEKRIAELEAAGRKETRWDYLPAGEYHNANVCGAEVRMLVHKSEPWPVVPLHHAQVLAGFYERATARAEALTAELAECRSRLATAEALVISHEGRIEKLTAELAEAASRAETWKLETDRLSRLVVSKNDELAKARGEAERLRADLDVAESRKSQAFHDLHNERDRLRAELKRCAAIGSEAGDLVEWFSRVAWSVANYDLDRKMREALVLLGKLSKIPDPAASETAGEKAREERNYLMGSHDPSWPKDFSGPEGDLPKPDDDESTWACQRFCDKCGKQQNASGKGHVGGPIRCVCDVCGSRIREPAPPPAPEVKLPRLKVGPDSYPWIGTSRDVRQSVVNLMARRQANAERLLNALADEVEKGRE